ncbi:MAG TPA: START domain-containing protein [Mucilaginibacter sp.]|jgi:hypothetical protein
MRKSILLISLFLIEFSIATAQGSWELKRNEAGIEVYTRKAATGNLKELRVVCELDATKAQLISKLQDIENYNTWVFSNKKSTILKTIDSNKIIYYTQTRLPWPIKDRDLVLELNIHPSPDVLNVIVKSLPDYTPKNNGYIRVPYSLAQWKVVQGSNNKLKVDYTFSVDPGGSIPAWIVNATMTVGPFNSFLKLRDLLRIENAKE